MWSFAVVDHFSHWVTVGYPEEERRSFLGKLPEEAAGYEELFRCSAEQRIFTARLPPATGRYKAGETDALWRNSLKRASDENGRGPVSSAMSSFPLVAFICSAAAPAGSPYRGIPLGSEHSGRARGGFGAYKKAFGVPVAPTDCKLSPWSPWAQCSAPCGAHSVLGGGV